MFDKLPQELKERDQWVCWTLEERNGKPTKVPRNPRTGDVASVTSPWTWSDFETAVDSAMQNGFSGIGFVFSESDPYVGIDVDHDLDMGLAEWFDSYAEKTQSGNGIHIIVRGELLHGGRKSKKYEIYDRSRFFVMTGDVLLDRPIREDKEKIEQFLEVFPAQNSASADAVQEGDPQSSDEDVLRMIRNSSQCAKFELLWDGDWKREYPSQSEADGALLSVLRFWTGGHKEQTLRIFSQSQLAERDKWKRPDYRESSWNVINRGPVRDVSPVTAVRVPSFLRKGTRGAEELNRVRDVLDREAREAIAGTPLETIVQVLEGVTDPPLPLALTLPKAYAVIGAALTRKATNLIRSVHGGRGVDLAAVVIDTAGGQACNMYTLSIAESASGKDIGSIVNRICAKKGWGVGGTGSAEGFMDVLAEKTVAVMEIGEFQNWLDQRHWQSKAAPTVTDLFNKFWFEVHLSQRGDGEKKSRQSNYCALSIAANVQPGVIQRFADRLSLDSGFLNRFLLCQCRNNEFRYPQKIDVHASLRIIEECLGTFERIEGRVHVDMRAQFGHLVEEFCGAPFAPHWKRLINEYGPRLSLMLSPQEGTTPQINSEGIRRASILIRWHYQQALDVFKWFEKDDHKWERFVVRVFKAIKAIGSSATRSSIAHKVGGAAKQRQQALEELVERGFIEEVSRGQFKIISEPKEWRDGDE